MFHRNKCVLCQKPITVSFWVCRECEERYGLVGVDYKDWPKWVKAIVSIERRNKYIRGKLDIVPLTDLERFEEVC